MCVVTNFLMNPTSFDLMDLLKGENRGSITSFIHSVRMMNILDMLKLVQIFVLFIVSVLLYKSAVAGSSRESTVTHICSSFCMIVGAVILASFVVACAKKSQAEEDARQPLLEEREARREEREDSRDRRNKEVEDRREQQNQEWKDKYARA